MAKQWFKCPSCKADVFIDVQAKQSGHKAPECEWFAKAVKEHKGSEGVEVVIDQKKMP